MYSVKKSYRSLFGIPIDQDQISEAQAKDILTKEWKKTGKPHPKGLDLFLAHPSIKSDTFPIKTRIDAKQLLADHKAMKEPKKAEKKPEPKNEK